MSELESDLLLNLGAEAIGIVITVLVINKILERREEARWRPTKQNLYFPLFNAAESLVTSLTPRLVCQSSVFMYQFDESGGIPSRLTNCRAEFDGLGWETFHGPAAILLRDRPRLLFDQRRELNVLLGQSAAIMDREPELNRLVTRLNTQLDLAIEEVDQQLASATTEGPGEDAAKQVAIWTQYLAHDAYDLWEWLADQATGGPQDWTALARDLEDGRERRRRKREARQPPPEPRDGQQTASPRSDRGTAPEDSREPTRGRERSWWRRFFGF